jgi:hypothetical protein
MDSQATSKALHSKSVVFCHDRLTNTNIILITNFPAQNCAGKLSSTDRINTDITQLLQRFENILAPSRVRIPENLPEKKHL